ncbi:MULTISPECIES: hypothetical protein [unclassified Hydrogenobaculum]|uniref:hypothetical protein n=1 Tax=unclassified Hydrogenobaculum TaxID=2622382 RepID=UPI0001C502E1|nr:MULTISPECIES: hypothetical protein [unclassified Hydrogenobaculum]AEF19114.1 hypothetical protein Hyd3684_0722 [Hydrogenobaculum sp. 3684]AEG46403.1 hypothetical protein HydSHO_0723 [Hydrogenobaculum sp. SHO]AGG15047.1 hypothetical protein HydHO_0726 [Hydrogenobaculum sp. HO]AGH93344.1 hypothetical protein HydSN_0741 [Hydrogenobaculum sp. SN]
MWFIIEILLALSILSTVLTGIYYLIPAFNRSTDIAKSQVKSINLKNALLNIYMDIANAEQNCGGYSVCPATPLPCNISYTNGGLSFSYVVSQSLNVATPTSLPRFIQSSFNQAGCSVSVVNSNTISVFCPSVTASSIDFCSNSNYESYTFVNPNPPTMPSITFYTILQPNNPASPLSAPYVVDYTPIYQYYQNQSLSKFEQIASAMKNYVLERRTSEIANSCTWNGSDWTGGMESSYDFYVPWILQACSSSPNSLCQSPPNPSVCSNSCTNISLSQNCSITTLLTNVGLVTSMPRSTSMPRYSSTASSFYYVDGFGNSITIVPYANLQGTLADIHPSSSYMTQCQSGTNCPPFAGVIELSNISATCVQAGEPYCYLQFTYP